MNNNLRNIFRMSLVTAGVFLILIQPAWAEAGGREWRPIYDFIMRWINFGILVFFLVKVLGPILTRFLSGQQADIQSRINAVREKKEEILARVKEARASLEDGGMRLKEIKSRIIERGEKRKQEIIEQANEQSQLMMKHARQKIDNQIIRARRKLMEEMVDMAMEKAVERLPAEISEEDNRRLVEQYFAG